MIFQKSSPKIVEETDVLADNDYVTDSRQNDEVETVVGPSVNVEGDFASEGNIIVKGTVAGSVHTSRHISVEVGAKVLANVRSGSATIAGEVRGNMKIKESLELTSTARVLGDIEVKTLVVEAGALVSGKISMPGLETGEGKVRSARVSANKKNEEIMAE